MSIEYGEFAMRLAMRPLRTRHGKAGGTPIPIAGKLGFYHALSGDLDRLLDNLSEILDNIRAVSAEVHRAAGSSRKIVDIVDVIEEIAFQTNLLSLNATVEVARAREQGRRALAEASATSGGDNDWQQI